MLEIAEILDPSERRLALVTTRAQRRRDRARWNVGRDAGDAPSQPRPRRLRPKSGAPALLRTPISNHAVIAHSGTCSGFVSLVSTAPFKVSEKRLKVVFRQATDGCGGWEDQPAAFTSSDE